MILRQKRSQNRSHVRATIFITGRDPLIRLQESDLYTIGPSWAAW